MTTSRRFRAILALVFVNVLWGVSFPLMRMIDGVMDRAVPAGPDPRAPVEKIVGQLTRASFYTALRFAIAMLMLAMVLPSLFRRLYARRMADGHGGRAAVRRRVPLAGRGPE